FVLSASLLALTITVAGDGRSAGAVYAPSFVIVPTAPLPPATPFTAQITAVSVEFFTLAVKLAVFPSTTDPLLGVTTTCICGGGGCVKVAPPPPPQPPKVPADTTETIATVALSFSRVV